MQNANVGESSNLVVKDILGLPEFKHATLAAGNKGLGKKICWIHVLEHVDVGDFINGYEIILTTGARWKRDEDLLLFVNTLINKKVSALCIQLGPKYNKFRTVSDLPSSVIAKANSNNFPLIVFPESYDCRFIDLIFNIQARL